MRRSPSFSRWKPVALLALLMAATVTVVTAVAIGLLYDFNQRSIAERLRDVAETEGALVEAITAFDRFYGLHDSATSAYDALLTRLLDATERLQGIGRTGELVLGRQEGEDIVFDLPGRHDKAPGPRRLPLRSRLALPMAQALAGKRGVMIAVDPLGREVLAAYRPVAELEIGIVAQMDLAEVREPFVRVAAMVLVAGLLMVGVAILLFIAFTRPMIQHILAREEEVRGILDTAVDGILTIDAAGSVQTVNPAVERMFGYRADELVGRNVSVLMPSPDRERHDGYLRHYLHTGERKVIGIGREVRGRRKDGTEFPLLLGVSETRRPGGRSFTGMVHDLTERQRLEAETRKTHSLATLTLLSRALAHHFNNGFQSIRSWLEVLEREIPPTEKGRRAFRSIQSSLARCADLTEHLMAFSGSTPSRRVPVVIETLVRQIGPILQSLLLSQVQFEVDIGPEQSTVLADPRSLRNALLQLVLRAGHSLPAGGRVRLIARGGAAAQQELLTLEPAAAPWPCALIAIEDDGPPLADEPDAIGRAPTRLSGDGPVPERQGLALARDLMLEHDGRFHLERRAEGLTRVLLFLPLLAPPVEAAREAAVARPCAPRSRPAGGRP